MGAESCTKIKQPGSTRNCLSHLGKTRHSAWSVLLNCASHRGKSGNDSSKGLGEDRGVEPDADGDYHSLDDVTLSKIEKRMRHETQTLDGLRPLSLDKALIFFDGRIPDEQEME